MHGASTLPPADHIPDLQIPPPPPPATRCFVSGPPFPVELPNVDSKSTFLLYIALGCAVVACIVVGTGLAFIRPKRGSTFTPRTPPGRPASDPPKPPPLPPILDGDDADNEDDDDEDDNPGDGPPHGDRDPDPDPDPSPPDSEAEDPPPPPPGTIWPDAYLLVILGILYTAVVVKHYRTHIVPYCERFCARILPAFDDLKGLVGRVVDAPRKLVDRLRMCIHRAVADLRRPVMRVFDVTRTKRSVMHFCTRIYTTLADLRTLVRRFIDETRMAQLHLLERLHAHIRTTWTDLGGLLERVVDEIWTAALEELGMHGSHIAGPTIIVQAMQDFPELVLSQSAPVTPPMCPPPPSGFYQTLADAVRAHIPEVSFTKPMTTAPTRAQLPLGLPQLVVDAWRAYLSGTADADVADTVSAQAIVAPADTANDWGTMLRAAIGFFALWQLAMRVMNAPAARPRPGFEAVQEQEKDDVAHEGDAEAAEDELQPQERSRQQQQREAEEESDEQGELSNTVREVSPSPDTVDAAEAGEEEGVEVSKLSTIVPRVPPSPSTVEEVHLPASNSSSARVQDASCAIARAHVSVHIDAPIPSSPPPFSYGSEPSLTLEADTDMEAHLPPISDNNDDDEDDAQDDDQPPWNSQDIRDGEHVEAELAVLESTFDVSAAAPALHPKDAVSDEHELEQDLELSWDPRDIQDGEAVEAALDAFFVDRTVSRVLLEECLPAPSDDERAPQEEAELKPDSSEQEEMDEQVIAEGRRELARVLEAELRAKEETLRERQKEAEAGWVEVRRRKRRNRDARKSYVGPLDRLKREEGRNSSTGSGGRSSVGAWLRGVAPNVK
ncbi:hypothetical protein LshimejAT787_0605490 [Lyophyllum shimeji]|uniref:Uncharacterized protein n=1 Tax=Lyophyllum shimeji TaxID=47721 RepID=A0A9P3UNJ3_LYOSH|nr:hypothetical protein LshimejAT787_0605490 [Lyophyllum shimeji]